MMLAAVRQVTDSVEDIWPSLQTLATSSGFVGREVGRSALINWEESGSSQLRRSCRNRAHLGSTGVSDLAFWYRRWSGGGMDLVHTEEISRSISLSPARSQSAIAPTRSCPVK